MGWTNQNVIAQLVIIEGENDGLFVYSGAPAEGTLVAALASMSGTDPYGNQYPAGFNFGTWSAISGVLTSHFGINLSGDIFLASSTGADIFHGRSSDGSFFFYNASGQGAGNLISAIAPGAVTDPATNHAAAGFTGNVNALQPGSNPNVPETWHAMSGGLAAGFSVGSFIAPRYQYLGIGSGGRVALSGAVNLTSNQAAGTTFFTLPAGYRPTGQQFLQCQNNLSGMTLGQVPITVTTGGAIQLQVSGTSGNFVTMDGVTFELD